MLEQTINLRYVDERVSLLRIACRWSTAGILTTGENSRKIENEIEKEKEEKKENKTKNKILKQKEFVVIGMWVCE